MDEHGRILILKAMRFVIFLKSKAFTLLELMVVVIIVGVLATLGIVQLSGPKEQALEKEAKSNLQLIAAAERMYRLESDEYVAAANATEINQKLRLMLPTTGPTAYWDYNVTTSAGNTEFNATARRISGPKMNTVFSINQTPVE